MDEPDDPYDIDASIIVIQANAHDHHSANMPPKSGFGSTLCVLIHHEKWFNLSPSARKTWDLLDEKYKALILGQSFGKAP